MQDITEILRDLARERMRQDNIFGEQNHPNGTGMAGDRERADSARHV